MSTNNDSKIYWKEYKNERYIFVDFKNVESYESFGLHSKSQKIISKEAEKSIKSLVDLRGSDISISTFKTLDKISGPIRSFIQATAFICDKGDSFEMLKQITSNDKVKSDVFETEKEAFQFLFE